MQFIGDRKRQRRSKARLTGARRENANLYPHRLQFYRLPPIDNITLSEFEDFAINRLKGNVVYYVFVKLKVKYSKNQLTHDGSWIVIEVQYCIYHVYCIVLKKKKKKHGSMVHCEW